MALFAVHRRLRNPNISGSRVTISVSLVQVASRGRPFGHFPWGERESMRVIYLAEWGFHIRHPHNFGIF